MKSEENSIYLREMTIEDTDDIVRWRNYDFVRENFIYRGEFTKEGHLNWIKTMVDTKKVVQYIIVRSEDNKAIGSVYLRDIDYDAHKAEYGIFIGEKDALEKGYGSQAVILMTKIARESLGLNKLFLRVYEENQRAVKSYLHGGFTIVSGKEEIKNDKKVIFMETNL